MEENNVKIYKEKRKMDISIFLIISTIILFFVYGNISLEILNENLSLIRFIVFLFVLEIYTLYIESEKLKNALEIKNDGRTIRGEVIHILKRKISDRIDTRFIIKYMDRGFEEKYIITQKLPHGFTLIKLKEEPMGATFSENYVNVNVKQFFKNGYILIDESYNNKNGVSDKIEYIDRNGKKRNVYSMQGEIFNKDVLIKNFDGEISCDIYERDGKYVIDDFEGIEVKNTISATTVIGITIILFTVWIGWKYILMSGL